mgnify:CR=1 FL=1
MAWQELFCPLGFVSNNIVNSLCQSNAEFNTLPPFMTWDKKSNTRIFKIRFYTSSVLQWNVVYLPREQSKTRSKIDTNLWKFVFDRYVFNPNFKIDGTLKRQNFYQRQILNYKFWFCESLDVKIKTGMDC